MAISFKMISENDSVIRYAYEGEPTYDYSKSGIFEIDKSVFKDLDKKRELNDLFSYTIKQYQNKKIKVLKICQYPDLSEGNEEYCAIFTCANIILYYFNNKIIMKESVLLLDKERNLLKKNEEFVEIMKRNGFDFK